MIVWSPSPKLDVLKLARAWPLNLVRVTGAWATPSIEKVIVPVGVPDAAATVAVNVTEMPGIEGLGAAVSCVVVAVVVLITTSPILLAVVSVKYTLPSGPAVMPVAPLLFVGISSSV